MFFFLIFFVFITTSIFSQESALEKAGFKQSHNYAALGYRRDRQKFVTLQNGYDLSIFYKARNTFQYLIGSHTEWTHVVLDVEGYYGWLFSGDSSFVNVRNGVRYDNLNIIAGYNVGLRGVVGPRFNLYHTKTIEVDFLPKAGYEYAHMQNINKSGTVFPNGLDQGTVLSFPKGNQQDWFGPVMRAGFQGAYKDRFFLNLFYQYAKPNLRSKTNIFTTFYEYSGDDLVFSNRLQDYYVFKGKHLQTHLGGVDFRVHTPHGVTFGGYFEGATTFGKTSKGVMRQTAVPIVPRGGETSSEDTRQQVVHWTEYFTYLFVGFKF